MVFTATRQFYIDGPDKVTSAPATTGQSSLVIPERITATSSNTINAATFGQSRIEDPLELARQASEFFSYRQFDKAADAYERLLAIDPDNAETYNNLGITLHYLGKSSEALQILNEGIAVDPSHQRTWLTQGGVNSQLGNIEQARTSLTTATKIDPDNEIGQSAAKMLQSLP